MDMENEPKMLEVTFLEMEEDPNVDPNLLNPERPLYTALANEKLLQVQYMPRGNDVIIDPKCCYIYDGYLYAFRGFIIKKEDVKTPGIYFNRKTNKYVVFLCDPNNPDHDVYKIENNQMNPAPTAEEIKQLMEEKGEQMYVVLKNNTAKNIIPPITPDDNALKRALKMVLQQKGIRLDDYKSRFASKNEVCNLNQVLKSSNKLSIMLWDRAMEALKLKYVITVTDLDPESTCGAPLKDPIVVDSEDTFDMTTPIVFDDGSSDEEDDDDEE